MAARSSKLVIHAKPSARPRRIFAVIIAIEKYRRPSTGKALPDVAYARADAEAFAEVIREIYSDLPEDHVVIDMIEDGDASLTALQDHLLYTIKGLEADDLFIFYYAGHGFHGAGGNRLSAYDTNQHNIGPTSLAMNAVLLEPLSQSQCKRALVFVDACAEQFRELVGARDVISDLDRDEVEEFLDEGWYCGVFLSCSPGEKSYPSETFGHGIWTFHLLQALSGRAEEALVEGRWLTDYGLRDYLAHEVPRYITRETEIRGSQRPQAIIVGSNSFRIRHVPEPVGPPETVLSDIKLKNNSEYLESIQTGQIGWLPGFRRGTHTVPLQWSDSADSWCRSLLTEKVSDELQELYESTREALQLRRRDIQKADDHGNGSLDAPPFRFTIDTGQNTGDPSQYIITRRVELRPGWVDHRETLDGLFEMKFEKLVIELEDLEYDFDDLVDLLEDAAEAEGGAVTDDDRVQRIIYQRDDATLVFDLDAKRLEISVRERNSLKLIDAVHEIQLGFRRKSPMLPPPPRR